MRIFRDGTGRLIIDGEQNTVIYVTDPEVSDPDSLLKNELPDEKLDPSYTGFTVVFNKKVDFRTPPSELKGHEG